MGTSGCRGGSNSGQGHAPPSVSIPGAACSPSSDLSPGLGLGRCTGCPTDDPPAPGAPWGSGSLPCMGRSFVEAPLPSPGLGLGRVLLLVGETGHEVCRDPPRGEPQLWLLGRRTDSSPERDGGRATSTRRALAGSFCILGAFITRQQASGCHMLSWAGSPHRGSDLRAASPTSFLEAPGGGHGPHPPPSGSRVVLGADPLSPEREPGAPCDAACTAATRCLLPAPWGCESWHRGTGGPQPGLTHSGPSPSPRHTHLASKARVGRWAGGRCAEGLRPVPPPKAWVLPFSVGLRTRGELLACPSPPPGR